MEMIIRRVRISDEQPLVDIGIADGRIVAIEEKIEKKVDEEIDAEGRVALPGFIEAHLHLEKAFLHRRMPARFGTLEEAIRVTGILKSKQEREDVLDRSRQVLDMAIKNGTTLVRAHPDVDPIQGLIGVETALQLKEEYRDLLDLQIVAFPQEGWLKTEGVQDLMENAVDLGADVVGGCPYNELSWTIPAVTSTRPSIWHRSTASMSICMSTSPTIPRIAASRPPSTSRERPSTPAIMAASPSATSRASAPSNRKS